MLQIVQVSPTTPDGSSSQVQAAALYEVQAPSTVEHDFPPPLETTQYHVGEHEAVDGQSLQGSGAEEQSRVGATFGETRATSAAQELS
jgi:hypothetical protein